MKQCRPSLTTVQDPGALPVYRLSAADIGDRRNVAAVETTPEGKPIRLKLRRVKGFRRAEIATLAQRNFHPSSFQAAVWVTPSRRPNSMLEMPPLL